MILYHPISSESITLLYWYPIIILIFYDILILISYPHHQKSQVQWANFRTAVSAQRRAVMAYFSQTSRVMKGGSISTKSNDPWSSWRLSRRMNQCWFIDTIWLFNIGKSPCLIGKPAINGPCSMAMLNNQRVVLCSQ